MFRHKLFFNLLKIGKTDQAVTLVNNLYRCGKNKEGFECLKLMTPTLYGRLFCYATQSCHLPSIDMILNQLSLTHEQYFEEDDGPSTIFFVIDGYSLDYSVCEEAKLKAVKYFVEMGFPFDGIVLSPYTNCINDTPWLAAKERKYTLIIKYLREIGVEELDEKSDCYLSDDSVIINTL